MALSACASAFIRSVILLMRGFSLLRPWWAVVRAGIGPVVR
jgi:hypothetical protein